MFFNFPFCSAPGLQQILWKAMNDQKSLLIKKHPDKWPRMEWGRPLPEFEMIRDFVRSIPWRWRNREEKNTIQAYHKLAWQLECPTDEADHLYKLLKATKTSLYCLLGESTTILRAPGPTALPEMKKKLATAVNFHTSFQMCINHVPLRGLVDPDKEVELVRIVDDDGDVQESVKLTIRQILFRHQVNHLPLWQSPLQNDEGS